MHIVQLDGVHQLNASEGYTMVTGQSHDLMVCYERLRIDKTIFVIIIMKNCGYHIVLQGDRETSGCLGVLKHTTS